MGKKRKSLEESKAQPLFLIPDSLDYQCAFPYLASWCKSPSNAPWDAPDTAAQRPALQPTAHHYRSAVMSSAPSISNLGLLASLLILPELSCLSDELSTELCQDLRRLFSRSQASESLQGALLAKVCMCLMSTQTPPSICDSVFTLSSTQFGYELEILSFRLKFPAC